eukprot:3164236-Pleurochrysis_carterae.AAC.1
MSSRLRPFGRGTRPCAAAAAPATRGTPAAAGGLVEERTESMLSRSREPRRLHVGVEDELNDSPESERTLNE